MKSLHVFLYIAVFLLINSLSVYGATPGEVYEKYRQEIRQEKFNIFEGNIFIFIHSETGERLNSKSIFRKMKVKALKNLRSKYLIHKFPDINKLWFELYYELPSIPKYSIKKSFVVDKNIKAGQAYLVLTVPENQVSSIKLDIKKIKETVNREFDNGGLISLVKYSRVVSGKRLKKVKKEIARRAEITLNQEKNINIKLTKEVNKKSNSDTSNEKPDLLVNEFQNDNIIEERNIDKQVDQVDDVLSHNEEKFIDEDEIRNPIACVLPLCKKINKKNINKESKKLNKKSLNKTTIMNNNELDDLL
jgi:hypothetical protein